jgi:hypothetical protein
MESCSTFSDSLTTTAVGPQQQTVVWDLPLTAGPEGPTLISRAAKRRFIVAAPGPPWLYPAFAFVPV